MPSECTNTPVPENTRVSEEPMAALPINIFCGFLFLLLWIWCVSIEMCACDVESKSGMRGQKGFFRHSITRTVNTLQRFYYSLVSFYVSFSFAYEVRLNLYCLSFSLCHFLSNDTFLWTCSHMGRNLCYSKIFFFFYSVSLTSNIVFRSCVHTYIGSVDLTGDPSWEQSLFCSNN